MFHLQCGLAIVAGGLRPSNEQHKDISVIMRITRVPNSTAIGRGDIIEMSASPWGPHHRYNFVGDSLSTIIGAYFIGQLELVVLVLHDDISTVVQKRS